MPKTLTMIDPRPNGSGGQYERGQTYTLADDLADYFLSIGVARYPTLQQTQVLADRDPATGEVSTIGTGRDPLGAPVVAVTSPGGVVRNSLGELVWRPGWNQLVNTMPTRICGPYDRSGTATYSAIVTPSGGAVVADLEKICPISGLPMAKVTIPAGTSGSGTSQQIRFWDIASPPEMDADTVLMLPVRFPHRFEDVYLQILVSAGPDIGLPTPWRQITLDRAEIPGGMFVITLLQGEVKVTAGQTVIGTTEYDHTWTEQAGTSPDNPIRSVTIRAYATSAKAQNFDFHVGHLHYARKKWATGAVIWSADDIPLSIRDRMIPVLEDYGFRFTGNVVPSYAGDFSERMSHADILAGLKKGWEIWSHGWKHENLDSVTESERVRALTAARDYWARRGVPTAAALMAYPFGDYNVDVIQSARDLGYRLARITSRGLTLNPVAPACSPYALPAYSPEGKTKHQVLSMINRCRKAGTAIMTYTHNCDAGGADTESAPSGGVSFYEDHLRAWCEFTANGIAAGELIDVTATEYFRACGIDPLMHTMPTDI